MAEPTPSSAPLKTAEGAICERCAGSGEDPAGFMTHGHGPDDYTVDGPCRQCGGTGEPVAAQAPAAEPLPLLVRDIARDLGITSNDACQALKGLGNFSVNSAVTADMARKLRECFPESIAAPAAVAVPASWADSEDDKPTNRDDLERVMDEWNETTGALPRDSGWRAEVLGMLHDAYDLGAHQATPALSATESVLIEGVAYTIPEPVALELLRLNIELQQAEVQAEPVSSDPVAWHSKLYGTCWMHKQPYHLDAGTQFFVRGNPNPVATVLSGAAIQWHTGTAAFEHGTFFYTEPQAQPADALDAADWECLAIGRAINRAALVLPVDGEIRIEVENGAGAVYVNEPKHGDWRYIDSGDAFSSQINEAIDAAMAAAQEGNAATGKDGAA